MPIYSLWTLIVSLILLALGLAYKCAEYSYGLKLSEKETDRFRTTLNTLEETRKNETFGFRTEIDTLKNTHNKEISNIKELYQREIEEIRNKLSGFTHQAHNEKPSSFQEWFKQHKSNIDLSLDKFSKEISDSTKK